MPIISTILLGAAMAITNQPLSADSLHIDRQVNAIVADFNSHRFEHMDDYCSPDVEWINIVGMHWKGRNDVKKAHFDIFNAMFKGVVFTKKSVEFRRLTEDVWVVCLVNGVVAFFPPDGVDRGNNRYPAADNLLTLVFHHSDGKWLLAHAQNTQVNADAARHNPVLK